MNNMPAMRRCAQRSALCLDAIETVLLQITFMIWNQGITFWSTISVRMNINALSSVKDLDSVKCEQKLWRKLALIKVNVQPSSMSTCQSKMGIERAAASQSHLSRYKHTAPLFVGYEVDAISWWQYEHWNALSCPFNWNSSICRNAMMAHIHIQWMQM